MPKQRQKLNISSLQDFVLNERNIEKILNFTSNKPKFVKSCDKIDWLIDLITNIRSTKVNLNVSPGSFIKMSTAEVNSEKKAIINDNLSLLMRLGRISEVKTSQTDKSGIKIIVGGETIILYFDQDLNLSEQMQKISRKVKDLQGKMSAIDSKLKNKSFLKNSSENLNT